MVFRIFIAAIVLLAAYFIYDGGRLLWMKHSAYSVEDGYAAGDDSADIQVVEFVDYSCGKCQKTHPSFKEAMRRAGNIRHVPRPIFSDTQSGVTAGKFVYAAGRQGKFMEAHEALMQNYRTVDEGFIANMSKELGLDHTQIQADMEREDIVEQLEKNKSYNAAFRSPTIPAFLINGKIMWFITSPIPGVQDFLNVFEEAK